MRNELKLQEKNEITMKLGHTGTYHGNYTMLPFGILT